LARVAELESKSSTTDQPQERTISSPEISTTDTVGLLERLKRQQEQEDESWRQSMESRAKSRDDKKKKLQEMARNSSTLLSDISITMTDDDTAFMRKREERRNARRAEREKAKAQEQEEEVRDYNSQGKSRQWHLLDVYRATTFGCLIFINGREALDKNQTTECGSAINIEHLLFTPESFRLNLPTYK
jgi:hypothetical protein